MQKGAPPGRVQRDDPVEVLPDESAIGPGAPDEIEEPPLFPGLGDAGGDDLLRQDVERTRRDRSAIEHRSSDAAQQRRAFHELVER